MRTVKVLVRLSPDMARRLELQAERFGMSRADTCAFAIGQWVIQQESSASVHTAIAEGLRPVLERILDSFVSPDTPGLQMQGGDR